MSLTEYSIHRTTVSWMMTILLIVGGILAFMGLGRLEDPEFTIKEAVIVTQYPGASAQEVEEEVTLPIENALQQLATVKNVQSISSAGLSQVTVEMKSIYRKAQLAQIWDEMRRKINDMHHSLPPGAYEPMINDDFGDVYGVFLAVTGEGYSYKELADYVDYLRRELVLVPGVGKVSVGGRLTDQVNMEINRAKLTSLNLSLDKIQGLLETQNLVSDAGRLHIGSEYVRISATGAYDSVEDLHGLMLGHANGQVIYLGDVATLTRGYADPPRHLYRFNGASALTLGISFTSGVNVVEVGQAVQQKLQELEFARPVGMNTHAIYDQPQEVDKSVTDFLVSLAQAIGIVIVVLLVAMGLRSGILMSAVLLITILATFIFMNIFSIDLHRISLGALIIALGMLVDNAIVITEGILIGLKKGLSKLQAARQIVSQTLWPLFGATVISVTAFAPIGLSPDASGEFTGSLFWVLLISLMLSWVLAITLTPFFATLLFKEQIATATEEEADIDPYKGVFYEIFRHLLTFALRFRWLTSGAMIVGLAAALYGFGFVNQAFFPPSNLPMFTVDYWLPEGSDIRNTAKSMAEIEEKLLENPDIAQITATIGQGSMRFMLTYSNERSYPSYGQFIVHVKDPEKVDAVEKWVNAIIREESPDVFSKSDRIFIGPATKAKIEARISGPDGAVLRDLAAQAIEIFHQHPEAANIRHDWRERTKILRLDFAEVEGRRLGITKADVDNAVAMNVSGTQVGVLRDGSTLLPIVLRPPLRERSDVERLHDIQLFSPALGRYVSFDQVVRKVELDWEDPLIMRRDRKRTIQVWADPAPDSEITSFALFSDLRPQIEALDLPTGYSLEWGGEFEAQQDANKAVFKFVPLGIVVMIAITIALFNSFKQTAVVWLTVPLSIIGVTFGLLLFDAPFSFTAMLGFLSLSGMVLKNGIVLMEEIKRLIEEEQRSPNQAVLEAAISRLRPVVMAAVTTVLGLIPLIGDVFFAPLAITIMFGLGFATVLTLIIVPVLYALFYGVKYDAQKG